MKNLLMLFVTAILLSCNNLVKPDIPQKETADSISHTRADASRPVVSVEEEAQIKKDSLLRVKEKFPYLLKHPFDAYKAPVFEGTPAAPDFRNNPYANDPEYVAFITEGCKQGINFGGHYTLIDKSCGAMCEHLFIVDRKNGKIFTGTVGLKEVDGYYGFKYEKGSYLLITDATAIIDASTDHMGKDANVPALYKWNGKKFKRLE